MKRWRRTISICFLLIIALGLFLSCTEPGRTLSKAFLGGLTIITKDQERPRYDPRLVASRQGDSHRVEGITFTVDGKWIFSCGTDGLKQWDGSSFTLISSQEFDFAGWGRANPVYSVAADHSRPIVYLGTQSKDVQIWDYEAKNIVGTIPTRSRWCHSVPEVVISPNGKVLAIVENGGEVKGEIKHDDFTILLWDLENHREIRRLSGHGGPLYAVEFFPDGRKLYTPRKDAIWEFQSGELVHPTESIKTAKRFSGDVDSSHRFSFISKKLDFQSAGKDEIAAEEKLIHQKSITIAKRFAKGGIQAGDYILAAGHQGWVFLYDSRSGEPITSYQQFGNGMNVSAVAVSPDAKLIATGGNGLAMRGGLNNIQTDRNLCFWRLEPRTTR